MKRALLLFFLGFLHISFGQEKSLIDLQQMEDESLLEYFNEVSEDSTKAERVAMVYLERAKEQHDTIKMARGYDRLARIFHPKKNLLYADSIIALTKDLKHVTYPGLGYLMKAHIYEKIGNLVESTQYDFKAYKFAQENNNLIQQEYLLHHLTNNYRIWGNPKRALNLQVQRHELVTTSEFKKNLLFSMRNEATPRVDVFYKEVLISSYQTFASCYLELKKIDSAQYYLKKMKNAIEAYDGQEKEYYKTISSTLEVEIAYEEKKFSEVLKLIKSLKTRFSNFNMNNQIIIYRIEGSSLIEKQRLIEGVKILEKTDSLIDLKKPSIIPSDREVYEKLLSYYQSQQGSEQKQIDILAKMINADSIFKTNYQYFESNIISQFETPLLIKEKENLIHKLKAQNDKSDLKILMYLIIGGILTIGLFYFIIMQREYKKRYLALFDTKKKLSKTKSLGYSFQRSSIPDSTIRDILKNLEKFENKERFLRNDINLHNLAKSFGTNPKYLSRVVNLKKDTNFPQYLNNLRAEYAATALKEQGQLRKYSLKAIAQECGFKTAESFTRAFYKRHGIKPTYYLKQLEREQGRTN